MSGRKVYLVAYDVADPSRLRRVHRKLRAYGDSLQYSVFWCVLASAELETLVTDLTNLIIPDEDRVLLIDLGPQDGWRQEAVRFLGRALEERDDGPVIF